MVLQLSFYLSKKVSLCSLNGSFWLYLHVICPNWSFWGWTGSVTKLNPRDLIENYDHLICPRWPILLLYALAKKVWFLKILSSCLMHLHIVLKLQVISLKKMVVPSAKFTILISWSPICIPLILINEIGKYLSSSNV